MRPKSSRTGRNAGANSTASTENYPRSRGLVPKWCVRTPLEATAAASCSHLPDLLSDLSDFTESSSDDGGDLSDTTAADSSDDVSCSSDSLSLSTVVDNAEFLPPPGGNNCQFQAWLSDGRLLFCLVCLCLGLKCIEFFQEKHH